VLGLGGRDASAEAPERHSATVEPLSIYRSQRAAAVRAAPAVGDGPAAAPVPPEDAPAQHDAENEAATGGRARPAFPDARMLAAQSRLRSAAQLAPPPPRRVLPVVIGGVALALTTLAGAAATLHLLHPDLTATAWFQRGNDVSTDALLPTRTASAAVEHSGSGTTEGSAPAPSGAAGVIADAAIPLAPVEPPEGDAPPRRSTVVLLVERGDQMLATGDVASARLFYERAAAQGSAAAAAAVGKTLDPLYLRERGVRGVPGNADQAEAWYRKATDAGDDEARLLLMDLQSWRRAAR
jgi:TPR repeat protein